MKNIKRFKKQEKYWLKEFSGELPILNLPTDKPRPPIQTYTSRIERIVLEKKTTKKLKELAKQNNTSLFTLLFAIFNVFLYRITGQNDVVIGTQGISRNQIEADISIGLFATTSAVRTKIKNNQTFSELLFITRNKLLILANNKDYSFERLVEKLKTERDVSRNSLFKVLFQAINSDQKIKLHNVELSAKNITKLDISMRVVETQDNHIVLNWEYNADLFNKQTIERFLQIISALIDSIVKNPNTKINELEIVNKEEKQKLLHTFNNTKIDYSGNKAVHQLFEIQVKKTPNNIALEFEGKKLTYRELNEKANKLAFYLRNHLNIKVNSIVGIMLDQSFEMIIAVLGVLKTGGAYLPINPDTPNERIVNMLKKAKIKKIITQKQFIKEVNFKKIKVVAVLLDSCSLYEDARKSNLIVTSSLNDLAYVMFTSGSTGEPKGVEYKHRGLLNIIQWQIKDLKHSRRQTVLFFANLSFDISLQEIFYTLVTGNKLVIIKKEDKKNPDKFFRVVKEYKISILFLPPIMLNVLATNKNNFLKNINDVIVCGEKLHITKNIKQLFIKNYHCRLWNHYGPIETHVVTRYLLPRDVKCWKNNPSIGTPVSNNQVYVLSKNNQLQPIGIPGEIYISGKGLARGYINNKKKTDEVFLPHPFIKNKRIYKTGDLAKMHQDGNIEILGRIDHQIKLRGHRIEPGEIEINLNKFRGIKEVAVIARERRVDSDKYLVAYYTTSDNRQIKAQTLKEHLKQTLPDFMVPAYFMHLKGLPINLNGKLDRLSLPDPTEKNLEKGKYQAPQTAIEKKIASIWQDVLCIKKIGVNDNFFNLGGHSLNGLMVVNLMKEKFGELVHVSELFSSPTIYLLAKKLSKYEEDENIIINDDLFSEFKKNIQPISSGIKKTGIKNSKVLFILSPPRSGSTLLRVILAGNNNLFSPPQLELLAFNTLEERKSFFSGKFNFYLEGLIRVIMEIKKCDAQEAKKIMDYYEKENTSVEKFYGILQSWIGNRILVDKSPSYALDVNCFKRIKYYFDNPLFIHLSRNPYSSTNSFIENRFDQIHLYKNSYSRRELAELVYTVSHENINNFLRRIPKQRKINIKFEDLVASSELTIKKICKHFDIPYDAKMLNVYGNLNGKMVDGIFSKSKMIGDPGFLKHKSIESKYADEWKKHQGDYVLSKQTKKIASALGYSQVVDSESKKRINLLIKKSKKKIYYSLSHAQKRMFVLYKLEPYSSFYNINNIREIKGELDEKVLEKTFNIIIERHEALRTNFTERKGEPVQIINEKLNIKIKTIDLSNKDRIDQRKGETLKQAKQREIDAIIKKQSSIPFKLETDPLLRVSIIKERESKKDSQNDQYILIISIHHIIFDAWSMGIFYRELAVIYNALLDNQTPSLSKLDIQYKDYAEWEQSEENVQRLKKQEKFLLKELGGELPILNLPTDKPRPPIQTYNGSTERITVDEQTTKKLKELAKQNNTTLFILLFTIFNVFLYRITGQSDIVVGVPSVDRSYKELENNIGLFINTLALRSKIKNNQTFNELLAITKDSLLEILDNKDYPFEQLVEKLNPERDMSRNPLFSVLFQVFQLDDKDKILSRVRLGNTVAKIKLNIENITKFDIAMKVKETLSDGSILFCEYNTDLFKKETIQKFLGIMKLLINNIVKSPSKKIDEIDLVTKEEKNKLLKEFNSTKVSYSKNKTIHQLFEEQVKKTPNNIAVEFENKILTYKELNEKANQLACYLRNELKIKENDIVGLMVSRSFEMIIGVLGIIKAGGAYLPIDPNTPKKRIEYTLNNSKVRLILTNQSGQKLKVKSKKLLDVINIGIKEKIFKQNNNKDNPKNINKANDLIYVIYTSGSTGEPKGVMVEHRSVVNLNNVFKNNLRITEKDRIVQFANISFDVLVWETIMSLLHGASLIIPSYNTILNIKKFENFLNKNKITVATFTPSYLSRVDCENVNTLRLIVTGASKINRELIEKWKDKVKLLDACGPAETTVCSVIWNISDNYQTNKPTLVGEPIANTDVYVLDQNQQLQPIGIIGELYISGDGLARGYIDDKKKTNKVFLPHPFVRNKKIYKTGDLAKIYKDGNIEILGRKDYQVKIRGHRIELGEIETSIKKHNSIKNCVVVAREKEKKKNDNKNDSDKYLTAYCITKNKKKIEMQALKEYLKQTLPEYMIPSYFMYLKKLPLNRNGKLDRLSLPIPTEIDLDRKEYIKPVTKTEKQIAKIWGEILGVERVGLNDNFFNLGGHSLKILELHFILQKKYPGKFSVQNIFNNRTIKKQVRLLREEKSATKKLKMISI